MKKIFQLSYARWASLIVILTLALTACGGAGTGATATAPVTSAPSATAQAAGPAATATNATTGEQQAEPTSAPAVEPTTALEDEIIPELAKLNLNELTEDELLATIPNFSNRMVREFFEYRPYISITQFRREIGKYVDAAQVAEYEQYVYVPIDVDESDAATLQQIPGVDAALAEQLLAARPFGSNEAFLAQLAELLPGADLATAAGYLAQ